ESVERAPEDLQLSDRACLEIEPHAPLTAEAHETQGGPRIVRGQELGGPQVGRRRNASGERCDEIFRAERQTENLCDRLGVGRPDMSLVLHGVERSHLAFVYGDEQERRAEWRERFEADRARRLDEKNATEKLALAAPFQEEGGRSAQVGECSRANGQAAHEQ